MPFWTDREGAALARLYPWGDQQEIMTTLPDRTWKAIGIRASMLGIRRLFAEVVWSAEEEAVLAEVYPWEDQQKIMALLPDKTWGAIQHRAHRLGIQRLLFAGAQIICRNGIEGKNCAKCGMWKLLTEFSWRDRAKGRWQSWCKACRNEHYAENPEKFRERGRQHYAVS